VQWHTLWSAKKQSNNNLKIVQHSGVINKGQTQHFPKECILNDKQSG
jgi:hypothetical protein